MSTSDVESGTDLPSSSNSALPSQERHTERVVSQNGMREFLVIEHTANVRKNSKILAIWHHGGERRRLDDHSMERYWRCAYCKGSATILKVTGGNGGEKCFGNEDHRSMRMSTVVVEERRGLGHTNSVSRDAPGCGRGPIRNCIDRGQRVKRRG